jgi:hypothetical protein
MSRIMQASCERTLGLASGAFDPVDGPFIPCRFGTIVAGQRFGWPMEEIAVMVGLFTL